jgi:tetratricopeptide (TPR) repeat protein
MLRPVILLAGVFSLFLCNAQGQDLKSAIRLTRSEQFDKATAMFNQLIQKEPANSKNYFFLGENYLQDYFADTITNSLVVATKNAKDAYDKGVSANPNDPLNYVGLAKVAYFLGDNAKANELRAKAKSFLLPYKNIKKINPPAPEYAFTLAKLAESYIKNGKVDTSLALPLTRQAISIDPKNADIYLITGDIYMLINDGSDAIKNYNLAQYANPESPTANMKIGYVYFKSRALQQAIPYYEEAIKLDANYAPVYRELGQLYWRAGRIEQSKEYFKKYLDMTAGNIPAKTKYVNSLFYAGDYDEVIKNVEEILAVDKSRAYLNRLAGYSYFEKKNPDYSKAEYYMDQLFKTVDPEYILQKDYIYMARILLKKNQGYTKSLDDLNNLKNQLDRDKSKFAAASATEKAKLKPALDELTARVGTLDASVNKAGADIDRAFVEYDKALNFGKKEQAGTELTSQDRSLMNEIAASDYSFRRYADAAKMWAKLIDPESKNNLSDYMQVGRAYERGEQFKSADSVFNLVLKKSPDYLPAYMAIARAFSRQDPDTKQGLAKPKFEKVIEVAKKDSIKNESEMIEALSYLGYYYMENGNYTKSKDTYERIINLDPNNKENKIKGYNGMGVLELKAVNEEKTLEGKIGILGRAQEDFGKILALDANNASAKSNLRWVDDYIVNLRKGINPNEIKGLITSSTGQPIPYASVRVKDTAAESLTNTKGEYKFEIPQGSETLVISAKGFKSVEVPITKSRIYNVKLENQ